jgi:hypothetical protein
MWFSWKYINKVNFWENARGKNRPAGRTSWKQPKVSTSKDGSAEVLMELLYTNPDNEDLLSEDRIIRVESPKSDGAYVIHWQSRFTALAETVELDRTPVPEGARGSRPGGYAGLSLRLADLQERAAVTDRGAVDFMASTRYRGRHEVFEYNGVVDGNEVGIAMTDHAENLNAPSPWYAIRSKEMSFIAPAVICYGAHTMKRGDTFSLQYQVHIHHDRWDSNMLQQLRR